MTYPSNDGPSDADTTYRVTASELRSFVERIENLEVQRKEIGVDIREIYTESKARGYDTAVIRKLIADRKKDPNTLSEFEAILDLYKEVLGDI